jgi:hypothetical protein
LSCQKTIKHTKTGEKIMRKKSVQMSLSDIYNDVSEAVENKKPKVISLLEEHIDFENIIPEGFYRAFYSRYGRNNIYHLESYIRVLLLQKILGIPTDKLLLDILKCSSELTDFCGFDKIPDGSALTRFKQRFAGCLAEMFEKLVDLTEPICREIDAKRADYLIYDTTGITFPVAENNPKYLNGILKETKRFVKKNPKLNPYGAAYNLMPSKSETNPDARQQYINGHFCYAAKVGILTNGLGIPRHIAFFDGEFRKKHPEIAVVKTDNPDFDKEIGDSKSLRPVMSDFRQLHSALSFKTFLGDSAFDSYDNYAMLNKEFGFDRVCVPMNTRNSKNTCAEFDGNGTPVCPIDRSAFTFLGESGGRNRSRRFKWVCPKSVHVKGSSARVCTCESPCTSSSYGRCVYTYPDKDFRFYPGIPRGTAHWDNLYRHRVVIERTIHTMKDTFALDSRRSHNTVTAKADVFIAGIVQLVTVILADAVHKRELFKSIRKLIA